MTYLPIHPAFLREGANQESGLARKVCSGETACINMARYHITIVRPAANRHSECFREVSVGLYCALQELGHTVTMHDNWVDPSSTTIVFGAHLLSEAQAFALPLSTIVYNLEPLGGYTAPPWFPRVAESLAIWDYTAENLRAWDKVACRFPVRVVQIGYVSQLTRIKAALVQDIDVLFYGALTERRRRIFDALAAAGLKTHVAFNVYGPERDDLIARAKLVLNLHAEEMPIFEVVRVSYLLANRKAVVAEDSLDLGDLRDAVAVCTAENAVEICLRLLQDDEARHHLEGRGFAIFCARSQAALLAPALT